MKNLSAISWIVAAAVLAALLASALSFRADAQSEYMRGDRMPYDAFDRLPRTDLEIGGGTIHVGFAPGDMSLPREKLLDWVRMSAKAVTDLLRPVSRQLAAAVAGAGRWRADSRRHDVGLSRRGHSHPVGRDSTEDCCGATG